MPDPKRLFFALWPDPTTRDALQRLQHSLQLDGRPTPAANFHITLAFLGEQPVSALPALQRILAEVRCPPLSLVIDRSGYFSRLRLAWAGMNNPPERLFQLHAELQSQLKTADIPVKPSPGFRPHVTLARNTSQPPDMQSSPISWQASDIGLAESHVSQEPGQGALYRVLAKQPLRDED